MKLIIYAEIMSEHGHYIEFGKILYRIKRLKVADRSTCYAKSFNVARYICKLNVGR